MMTNQDIICLSTIDWDFIWQGHQEIMLALAQAGNRVLFIDNTGLRTPTLRDIPRLRRRFKNWRSHFKGIREEREGIFVYSPMILPFPYSRWARGINRRIILRVLRPWMQAVEFRQPILWIFLPSGLALDLIGDLEPKLTIYHCLADFAALSPRPRQVQRAEERILKRADLVFAQGESLRDHCSRHHAQVHVFGSAVRGSLFDRTAGKNGVAAPFAAIPGPRIGYVGGLHRHVDFNLLNGLARSRPDWSFVLVGPMQVPAGTLSGLPNVHALGEQPHAKLPDYIQHFDVCLIPYAHNAYTATVDPTKLHEYLLMGKPVVSTALPEVMRFDRQAPGMVRVTDNSIEAFGREIQSALAENDPQLSERRRAASRSHTWEIQIQRMSACVEQALARQEDPVRAWSQRWKRFYHLARQRTLRTVGTLALFVGVLFYTPLIWWVAAPLKITDPLVATNAIVVLGGGVGESGRPGSSTVERAHYGAQLYAQGLAPLLIFSTGYEYIYREADSMKLIATSLGVPSERIWLEREATSTRENAERVSRILQDQDISSILLVSSPYHMARARLAFRRATPGLAVHCAPVPRSSFYEPLWPVRPSHIQKILHEWAALLYDAWKGKMTR